MEPCSPELGTEVWEAILLEVPCATSRPSCRFDVAALEGDALVSGCAVELGWDEVTPFSGCSAVDDWVVGGTTVVATS